MILGSPHLSGLPESFDPATLRPLLDRLEACRPQALAIESLSGPQCDFMRLYLARYRDTVEGYCLDSAHARAGRGLEVPAATPEAVRRRWEQGRVGKEVV